MWRVLGLSDTKLLLKYYKGKKYSAINAIAAYSSNNKKIVKTIDTGSIQYVTRFGD